MNIDEAIMMELRNIEETQNVRILMAVESGSRAWGFASPDSDYDVRFLYVRPEKEYLKLENMRDVIEWKLDEVLDINGWDLTKTLRLICKSNPTIFEWFSSPIVYRDTEEFQQMKQLLPVYFSPRSSAYHYLSMARANYETYLSGENVRIKKYFYVLRPLLAARWVLDRKSQPPMLFTDLMDAELTGDVRLETERLLERKRQIGELGTGERNPRLMTYIQDQLEMIAEEVKKLKPEPMEWQPLDDYFLTVLRRDEHPQKGVKIKI